MRPALRKGMGATLAVALGVTSGRADAHGAEPIGIGVVEPRVGEVVVRVDRPLSLGGVALDVVVEAECAPVEETRTRSATRTVDERRLSCARPLAGRSVRVVGLDQTGLDAVLRVELADGSVHRSAIGGPSVELALPATPSAGTTLLAYAALGAGHLAAGLDHLLFVLGTLLLERRPRRAAVALTGFTVGHSLTLAATVLGVVRVPAAWAEIAIALSLVWVATAIARREQEPRGRALFVLPLAIGLVHGLGFAEVLASAGIPRSELPLALFGFNLGIELAQLALALAAFALAVLALRLRAPRPAWLRPALSHAIGAIAVMWCIERVWLAIT